VAAVDGDPPALVGLQPCVLELQVGGRALPAGRVEDGLRRDALAARQRREGAGLVLGDLRDDLAEPEDHVQVPEVVAKRLDDLLRAQLLSADVDGAVVDEGRRAVEERHAVPQQLVADHLPLALDDVARPRGEVRDRDLVLEPVVLAVDRALSDAGEVDDRLADRLRRDRPDVDAVPAHDRLPLHQSDLPPQLRRLDRSLLAGRPAPDDEQLVVEAHPGTLPREATARNLPLTDPLRSLNRPQPPFKRLAGRNRPWAPAASSGAPPSSPVPQSWAARSCSAGSPSSTASTATPPRSARSSRARRARRPASSRATRSRSTRSMAGPRRASSRSRRPASSTSIRPIRSASRSPASSSRRPSE